MTLQTSGPISASDIRSEFNGSLPFRISEYYRGGPFVPNTPINSTIPVSGNIAFSNFYGTSKLGGWTWSSAPTSLNEGDVGTFQISVSDPTFYNTSAQWYVNGTTDDFVVVSGSFTINASGVGTFYVTPISDSLTEGPESYTVSVYTGGTLRATRNLTIEDTSVTPANWVWTSQPLSMNEGTTAVFSFTDSSNTGKTGSFSWSILGAYTSDFNSINGTGTLTGGSGSFNITAKADLTTEGTEYYWIYVSYAGNNILASNLSVIDTSVAPVPTYTCYAPPSVTSGDAFTVTVATTNVPNGTILYARVNYVSGTTPADFDITEGPFMISGGGASFSVTTLVNPEGPTTKTFSVIISTTPGGVAVTQTGLLTIIKSFRIDLDPAQLSYNGSSTVYSTSPFVNITVTMPNVVTFEIVGGSGNYTPDLDLTFWSRAEGGGTIADLSVSVSPVIIGGATIAYVATFSRTRLVGNGQTLIVRDVGLRGKVTDNATSAVAYSDQFNILTEHNSV